MVLLQWASFEENQTIIKLGARNRIMTSLRKVSVFCKVCFCIVFIFLLKIRHLFFRLGKIVSKKNWVAWLKVEFSLFFKNLFKLFFVQVLQDSSITLAFFYLLKGSVLYFWFRIYWLSCSEPALQTKGKYGSSFSNQCGFGSGFQR
jgi:hypothetical protein